MTPMPPNATKILNLPHRRMEAWKWTDVDQAVSHGAGSERSGLSVAGQVRVRASDEVFISEGEGHVSDMIMGRMAAKFSNHSTNIYVPPHAHISSPIIIDHISKGHTRMALMVDEGASVTCVETHKGEDAEFSNFDFQIHLAKGASLIRFIHHDDPETTVRVATACVAMDSHSEFSQYALSFGGALSRLETQIYGEGEGIKAHISGAYLLKDKRHADMTSHVELKAAHGHIEQITKGVVKDRSRGVFQGKFFVHQDAQKTDAQMRHDALMLSDQSEIRAKPELEIYADDVACAHGNTIGALDENALFYMRQRGLSEKQARALLTEAFIVETFDSELDEALREPFITQVHNWLIAHA